MISYHTHDPYNSHPATFTEGFKIADTNDIERLKKGITGCVWSPIIWQDGYRRQAYFKRADWCVLDFDDGEMSLAEACQIFCDRIHIIGTTRSHQIEKHGVAACDRFRVAVRFSEPITDLHLYRWNMHKMMKIYPVDRSCKDGARFFFPCKEIISFAGNGYVEEVDENVPQYFERPPTMEYYKSHKMIPPWTKATLLKVFPEGYRNTTCYRIAKDLAALGVDADKITDIIIHSPSYSGKASETLLREIRNTVQSAIKSLAGVQENQSI